MKRFLVFVILFVCFFEIDAQYTRGRLSITNQIEKADTSGYTVLTDAQGRQRYVKADSLVLVGGGAAQDLSISGDSILISEGDGVAIGDLGLDTAVWESDGGNALLQKSDNDNVILGNGSGSVSLTGVRNFLFGTSLGQNMTSASNNVIFGKAVLPSLSNSSYNFAAGNNIGSLAVTPTMNYLQGSNLVNSATVLSYNYINGAVIGNNSPDIRGALLSGNNIANSVTSTIWYSSLVGSGVFNNATGLSYTTSSGAFNGGGASSVTGSTVNGLFNVNSGSGATISYSAIFGRGLFDNATLSIDYSFNSGFENAKNVAGADFCTFLGFKNVFQSTSDLQHTIGIGRENGFNAVDHSKSIYLGYRQGYTTGAANRLMIGMYEDNPLIYGEFDNSLLRVNGEFEVESTVYIEETLKLKPLTTAPTCDSGEKGLLYVDDTTNKLRFCDGTSWVNLN